MATMVHSVGFKSVYVTITQVTVSSFITAGFTQDDINRADHFHVQVIKNGGMRYWYDGTTPTSTEGHLLFLGESQIFRGTVNGNNVLMIADTDAIADIEVAITLSNF